MTLNDILTAALAQLDRGCDPQTVAAFGGRLTGFANEAQNDLARAVGFCRTDEAQPDAGVLNTADLPRNCIRVLKTVQLGREVRFSRAESGRIALPYDAPVTVTYRCEPRPMSLPGDVSELPPSVHGLIVSYVVARERMAGDPTAQRGANIYLSMYEAAKAKLRPHMGDAESYRLINRY